MLVDTGVLYALVDPDDQYHARAHEELTRLADEKLEVLIAYPILLESYSLVLRRLELSGGTPLARRGSRLSTCECNC